MLSRPTACHPAVQRHIRATSEAIWITDDILSWALRRFFLITKPSKRDVSSVPGPMECRRRIGKRRMANLSNAVQRPAQNFGALWDLSGALKKQQWQWEAPSKRRPSLTIEGIPPLPAWLSEHEPPLLRDLLETPAPEAHLPSNQEASTANIENELRAFKESLKASSTDRIQALCDSFNDGFRQSIALGLVSEDILYGSFQSITKDIKEATPDGQLVGSRCLSFYSAAWDGIKACTVLRPPDLGSDVLECLMCLLGQLPSTKAVQTLAVDIIQTASPDQIIQMEEGILSVVRGWLSGWTNLDIVSGRTNAEATASRDPSHAIQIMQPLRESVSILAASLGRLSQIMAHSIICASTDHLILTCFANFRGRSMTLRNIRYSWVSVVANMPCADENLLMSIWSRMDVSFSHSSTGKHGVYTSSINRITLHESCNLLLDFWISHGQVKAAESVRAMYEASIQETSGSDCAGHLIKAIKQYDDYWTKARCLFRFFRYLKRPGLIYDVFQNLLAQNLKLPAFIVAQEIEDISYIDPRCALEIYKIYHRIRYDNKPVRLDGCPNLVIAMIKSPDFNPADIWGALRIPLFHPRRTRPSSKSLPRARVRLVHKMALAFAQSECRSNRVALRNVMQCILYLRRHRVPLSAELTRALTHAGIIRNLLSKHWIGRTKALWILDMVKRVEGQRIWAPMDCILHHWYMEHMAKREQLRREGNPGWGL